MEVQTIDARATWPLRQAVLRPHQRIDEMALPGDDDGGAGHFGARDGDGRLVGVATVAPGGHPHGARPGDWRIRGMATAEHARGAGAGAALLRACLAHVRAHGGRRVWCNARAGVLGFYERAGFAGEGERFVLPDIGEHRVMALELDAVAAVVLDLDGVLVAVAGEVRRAAPLLPGAVAAVRRLSARWPLALASSATREVVDAVLAGAGLVERFAATVSSAEVQRSKPAPDVYLEAARRLGVDARACAAVEGSSDGLRAAHTAGMHVIATPNQAVPPAADALALAEVAVAGIADVTPELVASLARPSRHVDA